MSTNVCIMFLFYKMLLISLFSLTQLAAAEQTKLLMFESSNCYYCDMWNEEVGMIYPKTVEGMAAPIHKIDIFDSLPNGVILSRDVSFTPTFILLNNNFEVARLEGYPGEDFFWSLLSEMLLLIED